MLVYVTSLMKGKCVTLFVRFFAGFNFFNCFFVLEPRQYGLTGNSERSQERRRIHNRDQG